MKDLANTAAALVASAKGILAADESIPGLSAPDRLAYHEMLVTTPGLATGISGVILGALQSPLVVWPLTFCFGRALTGPALSAWQGAIADVRAGQRALASRVALNVAALERRYAPELDSGSRSAPASWPGTGS